MVSDNFAWDKSPGDFADETLSREDSIVGKMLGIEPGELGSVSQDEVEPPPAITTRQEFNEAKAALTLQGLAGNNPRWAALAKEVYNAEKALDDELGGSSEVKRINAEESRKWQAVSALDYDWSVVPAQRAVAAKEFGEDWVRTYEQSDDKTKAWLAGNKLLELKFSDPKDTETYAPIRRYRQVYGLVGTGKAGTEDQVWEHFRGLNAKYREEVENNVRIGNALANRLGGFMRARLRGASMEESLAEIPNLTDEEMGFLAKNFGVWSDFNESVEIARKWMVDVFGDVTMLRASEVRNRAKELESAWMAEHDTPSGSYTEAAYRARTSGMRPDFVTLAKKELLGDKSETVFTDKDRYRVAHALKRLKENDEGAFNIVMGEFMGQAEEARDGGTAFLSPFWQTMIGMFENSGDFLSLLNGIGELKEGDTIEYLPGPGTRLVPIVKDKDGKIVDRRERSQEFASMLNFWDSLRQTMAESPDGASWYRRLFDGLGSMAAQSAFYLGTRGVGTFSAVSGQRFNELRSRGVGQGESLIRGSLAGASEVAAEEAFGGVSLGGGVLSKALKGIPGINRFTGYVGGANKAFLRGMYGNAALRFGANALATGAGEWAEEFISPTLQLGLDRAVDAVAGNSNGMSLDEWSEQLAEVADPELGLQMLVFGGIAGAAQVNRYRQEAALVQMTPDDISVVFGLPATKAQEIADIANPATKMSELRQAVVEHETNQEAVVSNIEAGRALAQEDKEWLVQSEMWSKYVDTLQLPKMENLGDGRWKVSMPTKNDGTGDVVWDTRDFGEQEAFDVAFSYVNSAIRRDLMEAAARFAEEEITSGVGGMAGSRFIFEDMGRSETEETIRTLAEAARVRIDEGVDPYAAATDLGTQMPYGVVAAMGESLSNRVELARGRGELADGQRAVSNAYNVQLRQGSTLIRYVRGQTTPLELAEEVFETLFKEHKRNTGHGNKWYSENLRALDKWVHEHGYMSNKVHLVDMSKDELNDHDIVEGMSMLAKSRLLEQADRMNLPQWLKKFLLMVRQWTLAAWNLLKLGDGLREMERRRAAGEKTPVDDAFMDIVTGLVGSVEAFWAEEGSDKIGEFLRERGMYSANNEEEAGEGSDFSVKYTLKEAVNKAAEGQAKIGGKNNKFLPRDALIEVINMPEVIKHVCGKTGMIYMRGGTFNKIMSKHHFSLDQIEEMARKINDPMFVLRENEHDFLLMLDMIAANNIRDNQQNTGRGRVMVVLSDKNRNGNYILSSYALDSNQKIKGLIKKGNLIYSRKSVEELTENDLEFVYNGNLELEDKKSVVVRKRTANAPDLSVSSDLVRATRKNNHKNEIITKSDIINGKNKNSTTSFSIRFQAPNGNVSNLDEDYWRVARTNAFKKWFGDWEKVAVFEEGMKKLEEMEPVVEISGEDFQPDGKKLREKVVKYWNERYQGVAVNPTIGKVSLDVKGVKSSTYHGMGPVKAAAFMAVHDVIEKGVLIEKAENWKDRGYDTYVIAAPVIMKGEKYVCEIILTQSPEKTRFYLHELRKWEGLQDVFYSTLLTGSIIGASPRGILENVGYRVNNIKQKISEKVDENGEPLSKYIEEFQRENGNISFSIKVAIGAIADNGVVGVDNAVIVPPEPDFSISAWHAGMVDFDKFDTTYMGSGDGARAFGWGLYFTTHPQVNKFYWNKFMDRLNAKLAAAEDNRQFQVDYRVRLNVKDDELLDWDNKVREEIFDKLLAAENDEVREVAEKFRGASDQRGKKFYEALSFAFSDIGDSRGASWALLECGIKGVKYLDGSSGRRDVGNPTYNYVIFDGGDVDVQAKSEGGEWTVDFSLAEAEDVAMSIRPYESDVYGAIPRELRVNTDFTRMSGEFLSAMRVALGNLERYMGDGFEKGAETKNLFRALGVVDELVRNVLWYLPAGTRGRFLTVASDLRVLSEIVTTGDAKVSRQERPAAASRVIARLNAAMKDDLVLALKEAREKASAEAWERAWAKRERELARGKAGDMPEEVKPSAARTRQLEREAKLELKHQYSKAELVRLYHAAAEAATARLDMLARQEEVNKVRDYVEAALEIKMKGQKQLKGSLSVEAWRKLARIKMLLEMDAADKQARLDEIDGEIERLENDETGHDEDGSEYEDALERLEELKAERREVQLYGNIDGASLEEIAMAGDEIMHLVRYERQRWSGIQEQMRDEMRAWGRQVVDRFEGAGVKVNENTLRQARLNSAKLREVGTGAFGFALNFDNLLKILEANPALAQFVSDMRKRYDAANAAAKESQAKMLDQLGSIFDELVTPEVMAAAKRWNGQPARNLGEYLEWVRTTNVVGDLDLHPIVQEKLSLPIGEVRQRMEMGDKEFESWLGEEYKTGKKYTSRTGWEVMFDLVRKHDAEVELAGEGRGRVRTELKKAGDVVAWVTTNADGHGNVHLLMNRETEGPDSLELSRGNALYILLQWEQATGQAALRARGHTDASIARLREYVGDDLYAIGSRLRALLHEHGLKLAREYESVFGVPFPVVDNYYPARFQAVDKLSDEEVMQLQYTSGTTSGQANGWMKKRLKNHNRILDTSVDALSVFAEHFAVTENWYYMHDIVDRFRAMFRNRDVAGHMVVGLGMNDYMQLRETINLLERMGVATGQSVGAYNKLMSTLTGAHAQSILSYRIETLLKQIPAVLNGWIGDNSLSLVEYLGTIAHLRNGTAKMSVEMMMMSPEFKAREAKNLGEMGKRDIGELMKMKTDEAYAGGADRVLKLGGDLMAQLDAYLTAVGMSAVWNIHYKRARKSRLSETDAQAVAWAEVSSALHAAQPIDEMDKSYGALKKGPFGAAVFYMMSEGIAKFGKMIELWKSGHKKKAVEMYIALGFANALIGYLLEALKKDPDEWDDDDIYGAIVTVLLGPLTGIPGVSELMSLIPGLNVSGSGKAIIDFSRGTRATMNLYKMMTGEKDGEFLDYMQEVFRLVGSVGFLGGIGMLSTSKWIQNAGKWWIAVSALMNVPRFGIDLYRAHAED